MLQVLTIIVSVVYLALFVLAGNAVMGMFEEKKKRDEELAASAGNTEVKSTEEFFEPVRKQEPAAADPLIEHVNENWFKPGEQEKTFARKAAALIINGNDEDELTKLVDQTWGKPMPDELAEKAEKNVLDFSKFSSIGKVINDWNVDVCRFEPAPVTKWYSLVFVFTEDLKSVLLIRKTKPDWQAGLLNGVGGKMEPTDEWVKDCASRELFEETGLTVTDLRDCGFLRNTDRSAAKVGSWSVGIFCTILNGWPQNKTEELLEWHSVDSLPDDVLPNLKWLVPFCVDCLRTGSLDKIEAFYEDEV